MSKLTDGEREILADLERDVPNYDDSVTDDERDEWLERMYAEGIQ